MAQKLFSLVPILISLVFPLVYSQCVVFRLDDIQTWYVEEGQKKVIETFESYEIPLSIGVIGNYLSGHPEYIDWIKSKMSSGAVVLDSHGFNHEDFKGFNQDQQRTLLMQSKQSLANTFGVNNGDISVFYPPYNSWNSDTLSACKSAGFNVISSEVAQDNGPYFDDSQLLRFPIMAATGEITGDHFTLVPADTVMQKIQQQYTTMGYAAVMVHPYEWYDWDGTDYTTLNVDKVDILKNILSRVKSAGYQVCSFKELRQKKLGTPTPNPNPNGPTTCSARWQCQSVSMNYNYVDCVNNQCKCLDTFAGTATAGDLCRCEKVGVYWANNKAYCLQAGQCVSDWNGPNCNNVCSNIVNGIGTC